MATVKISKALLLRHREAGDQDVNVRAVYVDGQEIGDIFGVATNLTLPGRPTQFDYLGADGEAWTERRLAEARERLERDHAGD